jgi:uncharacterized phiE125 gp8 family phage protein
MEIDWTTTLGTAPTIEPVTVDDVKRRGRISGTDLNADVKQNITAARLMVEHDTGRQLITATWKLYLDRFPVGGGVIRMPYPPLQSVTTIKYYDGDGVQQTWTASEYRVDKDSEPARITEAYGHTWPATRDMTGAVEVEYLCGYGTAGSNVPRTLRQAIEVVCTHWIEFPELTITGTTQSPVALAYESLVRMERVFRYDGPTDPTH